MTQKLGEKIVLRAGLSTYVVFGIIFGFLTLLSGIASSADRGMAPVFAVCAFAWLVSYLWISSFRLEISEDTLTYRTLFSGTSTYHFTEIVHIRRESGVIQYSDRFKPFVRYVVTPETSSRRPLLINAKVFSAQALREFKDALQARYRKIGRPEVVKDL
jgi:hypothetical protein